MVLRDPALHLISISRGWRYYSHYSGGKCARATASASLNGGRIGLVNTEGLVLPEIYTRRASNEILDCDHVAPNIFREVIVMCERLSISFHSVPVILNARGSMLLSWVLKQIKVTTQRHSFKYNAQTPLAGNNTDQGYPLGRPNQAQYHLSSTTAIATCETSRDIQRLPPKLTHLRLTRT